MEQQQRSLVFTAAVGLIILAIIVGSIYYLVKFIQGRVASNRQTITSEQVAEASANPETGMVDGTELTPSDSDNEGESETPNQINNVPSDKKAFNGQTFQFAYPNNWGVLTCNNSTNVELDPSNPVNSEIACEVASKPVTIVVGEIAGCEGDTVKVGNIDVVKSVQTEAGYTKYQWCTKTTPVLNITHRVSGGGERATSKDDFSKQVEEIISKLSFSTGS